MISFLSPDETFGIFLRLLQEGFRSPVSAEPLGVFEFHNTIEFHDIRAQLKIHEFQQE